MYRDVNKPSQPKVTDQGGRAAVRATSTSSNPQPTRKVWPQVQDSPALTAHGHPGMPLHRSQGNQFLCTSCTYEQDDSCTYPQRPYAQECPMYRDVNKPVKPSGRRGRALGPVTNDPRPAWQIWVQDSPAGLVLLGLVGLAIWWVMIRR
jgi:hypothetical protein